MAFQTAITVQMALKNIHDRAYLLPAIQRDFVWTQDQICQLFDSLLLGYPIGSFLLWEVEEESLTRFGFYNFVQNYHYDNHVIGDAIQPIHGSKIQAVLDGQQRLTSLYIGFSGSYTSRKKYGRTGNALADVRRFLYLNLLDTPGDDAIGARYNFKFLSKEEAAVSSGPDKWFPVRETSNLQDGLPMVDEINRRGFTGNNFDNAYGVLHQLFKAYKVNAAISGYLEASQDADKVLDIFVRVNSGGTKLSFSDLLLSMATNQWQELDARSEVSNLVTQLNAHGFAFDKDHVLKSALLLCVLSPSFKIENFTKENMQKIEASWPEIVRVLDLTARFLKNCGFNSANMTAHSVAHPVALFIQKQATGEKMLSNPEFQDVREDLRTWILKSLLAKGIWGSGLDTLLKALAEVISIAPMGAFPSADMMKEMSARGKSLAFSNESIQQLLDLEYPSREAFLTLALIDRGVDYRHDYHLDHIFPKSRFTLKELSELGISDPDSMISKVNSIANLQLLDAGVNESKGNRWPGEWLSEKFVNTDVREAFQTKQLINDFLSPQDFLTFVDVRNEALRSRLSSILDE